MSQSSTTHRILVVDDEPSIAETVEYALSSDGFEVSLAETGEEALQLFLDTDPHFVILDVGLPDQSGFEVCRQLRRESNVPILFLTARESEVDRVVGLEMGGDDYVVKPFSPRELVARVKAIMRRLDRQVESADSLQTRSESKEGSLRFGPIQLFPLRFVATCEDVNLGLSRYELGLLRVFMEHPGRVFSRDQLMDLVWDEPDTAMDRTVDAHIKTLRAKLRKNSLQFDPIVTHRGLGYSLLEQAP